MARSPDPISFEDFQPGDTITMGPVMVTAEEIIAFAKRYDPQPFHLDEAAGKASLLGGLAASGWHVCSLFMAMFAEAVLLNAPSEGAPGIDYVKWIRPVLAGDVLDGLITIKTVRASRSRPGIGLVSMVHTITNQRSQTVCEIANTGMFRMQDRP